MKKRILVISWFFPPINSSEGLVTYKLLNNSSYNYDVFMQQNNKDWSYGKSEDMILNKNIKCINSSSKNLDEFKIDAINFFANNKDKYDIVMTRSMPEVSHIIGLGIKKIKPSIVWIASFGDPIGNNPFSLKALKQDNIYAWNIHKKIRELVSFKRIFLSVLHQRRLKKSYKILIQKNNELQERIINNCDYFICNSINQQKYMLKDYNNKNELEKKGIVLPHSYDDTLYTKVPKVKNDKIIFTFVGHLDDIRTPHSLFEAIKRLKENDNEVFNKVEFRFYGNMSDKEKIYIIDNELLDLIKIKKSVAYLESLKIMTESDWLIHIDANIQEIVDENIFFAAKIADYIGAKKNIFGITMINGNSADILRDYNAICIENCVDEIYNYLYLIIYENYNIKQNIEYREKYNALNVAKNFDEIIEKIEQERSEEK